MALVTITSDLGLRDFYVAALKGAILSHHASSNLVDVTHAIKPFDIREAAYCIKNAYAHFPKGSIHIVHVNATDGRGKLLLALIDGHYFITFDNGILSLAFEKITFETYQINEELLEGNALAYEQAIAKVIELLAKEYKPSDFGHLTNDTLSYRSLQPVASLGSIRGTVIYIDNFGNAVTNITKEKFDEFIGQKSFSIGTSVSSTNVISNTYSDVEEGELVCFFNSSNLLEVAVNKAKAENLLGLKVDQSNILIWVE